MKVKIEFELDFEELDSMSDEEKFCAIEEILQNGAEANCAYVNIKTIELKKCDEINTSLC